MRSQRGGRGGPGMRRQPMGGPGMGGGPAMRGQSMGGPGMGGGPAMRGQRIGGPGMGGGPAIRGQRIGGRGIASRPGMQTQGLGGPEYSESPSIPDLQEPDVSPEELADFPSNVRVVGVDELDQASFDERAPLIVRGAVTRASKKWTDEWLRQRFGNLDCQVSLHSRPTNRAFRKHMTLGEYLAILAKSRASEPALELHFSATDGARV